MDSNSILRWKLVRWCWEEICNVSQGNFDVGDIDVVDIDVVGIDVVDTNVCDIDIDGKCRYIYFQSIFAKAANPNYFRFGAKREIQYDSRSSPCSPKIMEETFEKNVKEKSSEKSHELSCAIIEALFARVY